MQLAIELNCNVILLDDLLARRAAEKKGLVPLGVLGVFKFTYNFKHLTLKEVRAAVTELVNNHGLFISPNILKQYFDSF